MGAAAAEWSMVALRGHYVGREHGFQSVRCITVGLVLCWMVLSAAPASAIVNLGMWLWTDPAQFTAHSITAWLPTLNGIAWTTTTATPTRLVFDSGEPGSTPMVCQGPGQRWDPSFGDDAVSACMYTYRHSS